MAKTPYPADVLESLKQSGVKFDEDGNIIEEKFIDDNTEIDEDVNTQEEEILEDELDADEEDDGEEDDEEIDAEEDDGEEIDDEEVEEEVKPKVKPKKSLTPKGKKENPDQDINSELGRLRKQREDQEATIARLEKLLEDSKRNLDPDGDIQSRSIVEEEIQKFKVFKEKQFASEVRKSVNSLQIGANFEEIINSAEWAEYMGSSVKGHKINDLYIGVVQRGIENGEVEPLIEYFEDFALKYLNEDDGGEKPSKSSSGTKKRKLEDLAVPEKTKASRSVKSRKFDFKAEDFEIMLDKAQRGSITQKQFVAFEKKFETALSKGRVKT